MTIVAADGSVLGDSVADPRTMDNHGARPEVIAARRMGIGEAERHSSTLDADFLYVAVPIPEVPGAVARVALPLHDVDAAVGRIRRDVAYATVSAAALAIAVAVIVARRITGPLEDLRRQAGIIATGRLDAVVRPAGTRELGDLARAFNAMVADLRRLVTEQEQSRTRLEATLANLNDGVIITMKRARSCDSMPRPHGCLGRPARKQVGQPFVVASRDHDLAGLLSAAMATDGPRTATVAYGRDRRGLGGVGAAVLRWWRAARTHGATRRYGATTPRKRATGVCRQRLARAAHATGLDPSNCRDARGRGQRMTPRWPASS